MKRKSGNKIINYVLSPILTGLIFILFHQSAHGQANEVDKNRFISRLPETAQRKNPFAQDHALTVTGKALYKKTCTTCHGDKGKGDGVAAASLAKKPSDHTSDIVQAEPDGALFYIITNGDNLMPAFKTSFTEKQRWALVNYIRTLAKPKSYVAKPARSTKEPVVRADNK